jgi:predicted LPLAT superfamily acyltransferase
MASWDGRSKGTTTGYRIFVWVLKTAGVAPAYALLRFVAIWYLLFSGKTSRHILSFLNRLGYRKWRSVRLLYANYCALGQTLIDRIVLMSEIPNRLSFDFVGEEYLRQMVAEKKGGLLVSAHAGNWEIAGFLLKRLGTTVNIVMYDAEHKRIKQYLEKVTGGRGQSRIIVVKDDLSHIYEISDALARNELVCMHADRFVAGSKTISLPFLGQDARFPIGPALIATMFRVPVSFTFAMKQGSWHYHFSATPPVVYEKGSDKDPVRAMMTEFISKMEERVREYPTQWYNYYDFWTA